MHKGLDNEATQRYVAARKEIEEHVDTIHAIGQLLSVCLGAGSENRLSGLETGVLGHIGKLISVDAGKIISCLDEKFLHVAEANEFLEKAVVEKATDSAE